MPYLYMLFSLYLFILLFLPATVVGFFVLSRYARAGLAIYWLIFASLFFYSFWNPIYLPILIGSILGNFFVANALRSQKKFRLTWLWVGIVGNLALLGYFKYADFFLENVNALFGSSFDLLYLALPIAISFFTFQQIAYLVDTYRGLVESHSFRNYVLFVSFFPQLVAGPIVHHSEMMPQFKDIAQRLPKYENIFAGLFLITVGFSKKIILADTFALWASAGFDNAIQLTLVEAWIVALSYTFQLYFDFSGYTDIALGAARLFNIKLPLNFNSPYKATSIQDFWRRWHMTLSRFLRDYVYIPLGGNRKGEVRAVANVGAVFLLGGLWHGAGWTFVVWGALHGLAVMVLMLWRKIGFGLPKYIAWGLTFLFVVVAWVFFRAETFADAMRVLRGMAGFNGVTLPTWLAEPLALFSPWVEFIGTQPHTIVQAGHTSIVIFAWIFAGLVFVFALPNAMEILERIKPHDEGAEAQ